MMEERRLLLNATLEKIADAPGFDAGICASGPSSPRAGTSFGVGRDLVLPSASLIKILILAALLKQADHGSLSLDDALEVRPEDLVEDS